MGGWGRLRWPARVKEDGTPAAPPMTREVAEAHVRRWLRLHERATGRPLTAIVALEYHRSGWPHFHGLLAGDAIATDVQRAYLRAQWNELAGYCRIETPLDVEACARYAAKYLTKSLDRGDVILWKPAGPPDRRGRRGGGPAE
jgi:hypothetical protein